MRTAPKAFPPLGERWHGEAVTDEGSFFSRPASMRQTPTVCPLSLIHIYLYYYEDMTTEEIARLLDRSPATVRSQLMRGRDRLRVLLEEG